MAMRDRRGRPEKKKLDADGPRQRLECNPAPLRAAGTLAREDVAERSKSDPEGGSRMSKIPVATGLIVYAVVGLNSTFAQAGPCSNDIAQFEAAIRQSASDPMAGLSARQSVAAQLNRQPTAASMKRAEARLKSQFAATMARAKRLDARGDRTGCTSALNAAKRMYVL
jgi:hypothetical protein